jgi:hypothetical protein
LPIYILVTGTNFQTRIRFKTRISFKIRVSFKIGIRFKTRIREIYRGIYNLYIGRARDAAGLRSIVEMLLSRT